MSSVWEGAKDPEPHVEMPKKDEEEMRKRIDVHTGDAATTKNEDFITWNEPHRKEDEVCARTAAKK